MLIAPGKPGAFYCIFVLQLPVTVLNSQMFCIDNESPLKYEGFFY